MTAPSANVAEALRREIAHRPCSSLMVSRTITARGAGFRENPN